MTSGSANAISGLQVSSVNINGQSYSARSSSSSSLDSSSDEGANVGLIVGLVVGLVSATAIIAALSYGYYRYQKQHKIRRLIDDPDAENELSDQAQWHERNTDQSSKEAQPESNSITDSPNSGNVRLHSPLPKTSNERVPSAAISITTLDHMTPSGQQHLLIPPAELIKFD